MASDKNFIKSGHVIMTENDNRLKDICGKNFSLRLEKFLKDWKIYGAVSTPKEVVRFMLKVSEIDRWEGLSILEPGCGFYDFSREIFCQHPNNIFTGVEINRKIYEIVSTLFPFRTILADFLLWDTNERFDLIIGNPPYGILGSKRYPIRVSKEVKEKYKRLYETMRGKYNAYGLFIEKGIKLLKEGGKLVFIVPCTFMILDEFSKLREFLARSGEIKIYYLDNKVFDKNVTVCVLVITKSSQLKGILELYEVKNNLRDIVFWYVKRGYKGEIIRFENEETRRFEEGKPCIQDIFELHFAARSIEYYKNPNVSREPKPGYICVLKGDNLHPNWIDYEHCYSGLWVPKDSVGEFRWFYKIPHIVVGHTKGGRIVAAVDDKCYAWREEIHLIPKVSLSIEEMKKIAEYLNSDEVQWYVKTLYKDITPHTTITQLRLLPLPKEYNKYLEGRRKYILLEFVKRGDA
jgi:adenine-specific DNA-methyltransferase